LQQQISPQQQVTSPQQIPIPQQVPAQQQVPIQQQSLQQQPFQQPQLYQPGTAPARDLSKVLTDLAKHYYDDKKRFCGEKYEFILVDLRVFYDNCEKVGLQKGEYNKGFSYMLEDDELSKAKLRAKPKEVLTAETPIIFNGGVLSKEGKAVVLRQKRQGDKLRQIDTKASTFKQDYMEQRARGAYIATVCQPKASFDLSVAAQHQEPTADDVAALNRRIKWQIKHIDRGVNYILIDLATANLYAFVDGSFANNKDFSSQLGYEIMIANETAREDSFEIQGNLLDWRSVKSQRITRSVLASEVYGMTAGVDMAYAIVTTLNMITSQLNLPIIPIVVCTDSYSLYECLVKLGTTKEKRLMIDIMAIRQSYERRELQEVRWINGLDNPADAMTKASHNKALETFLDTNRLNIRVEGWVKRS